MANMAAPCRLRFSTVPLPTRSPAPWSLGVKGRTSIDATSLRGGASRGVGAAACAAMLAACLPRTAAAQRCAARTSYTRCAAGDAPTLHVGLVGYGLVGQELMKQMVAAAPKLEEQIGVKLEIAAISKSKVMALLPPGSDGWDESKEEPADLEKLGKYVVDAAASSGGRAIIVDNTASDGPAEVYEAWLLAGADVATPNKRAGSGPFPRYEKIMAASQKTGARFLYEATVGAGLPVLGPLQALLRAGDEVESVEGIFSGTLSYIFNTWKPGVKFSDVVKEAKEKGFTEPDPRDDLGGTDVQRKVTILAREIGLTIELDDVPVKSLVPDKLQSWEPPSGKKLGDAFVEELTAYDDEMDALLQEAEAANEVLRFVGAVDVKAGKASVKLGRYPKDHPFASTQFADNICAVSSKWYTPRPLVVQGPGAGAAVTAAGVFSNVMEVMNGMR
ncbi:unnamed protein product [Effrenium voratum]|uniref:Homoserine dehydrogenase n=1 Tax=Effrenium voratum TaxID=2562239 RepID=A0AA36HRX9_9DINO|nr:unnamed protein product [Effrenium voratum]CAJ1374225.1 unnamed protein product [Effrenium voratum]CAJ1417888.1 unnamed protein product [Effrenium voratum]